MTEYNKCRDCIHLTKQTSSIGRRCDAPRTWKEEYMQWKYPSNKACKKYFERREA